MAIKRLTKVALEEVAQSFINAGHPKVFIRCKDNVPALWVTNTTGKNTRIITVDCPELPVKTGHARWFTPAMTVAGHVLCDAGFFEEPTVWTEREYDASRTQNSQTTSQASKVPTGLEG